jgi:hypothetical protein
MPTQRVADLALRRVIAEHPKRHGRVGVSYEDASAGLLIGSGEVEHHLELRCGPDAFDAALCQLAD